MNHPCERCRADLFLLRPAAATTLYGGVVAVLCPACRTDWHAYASTCPEWAGVVAATAREAYLQGLAYGGHPPPEADWQALAQAKQAHEAVFFALGQAWLAQTITRPKPEKE